jgi:hypothetical protein
MIRFQHGGAYNSDLGKLRDLVRANGTNVNCTNVPITHPLAPGVQVVFHINLAYQANGNLAPADASLYTVAFSNNAGATFRFNVLPPLGGGCAFPAAVALVEDGSYGSLGHALAPFPNIADADLVAAVNTVANHAGGALNAAMQTALVRLLIAVNEAVRFADVESGIGAILGKAAIYAPPWATIHNWGGHSLGG